jgi:acetyltransferase-like isoleucine patch superfamily enzyme
MNPAPASLQNIAPAAKLGRRVRISAFTNNGAGSVVTRDVPADTVFAGNPARFLKTI